MGYSKSISQRVGFVEFFSDWNSTGTNVSYSTFRGTSRLFQQSGERVERWRQRIDAKLDATSPYSFVRYSLDHNGPSYSLFEGVHKFDANLKYRRIYSGIPGVNQTFGASATPNENLALARLYQRIKQTRSEMNGLAFLGELRETLEMIRRPAKTLVSGIAAWAGAARDVYDRNPRLQGRKNRNRFAAVLHDSYLETVFGLMPAISDVSSLAESMARLAFDDADRVTIVRATSKSEVAESPETLAPVVVFWAEPDPSRFRWERTRGSTATVRYQAFLDSQLSSNVPESTFVKVARVTGVTLENVVPAAWELFPYSFLADYVSNIGQVIECQFTDTSSFKFGLRTEVVEHWVKVVHTYDSSLIATYANANNIVPTKMTGFGSWVKERRVALTRTKVTALPMPSLQFNLPNSKWKYANVAALALAKLNRVTA